MLHVSTHPVIQRDVTILRDEHTSSEVFRAALSRVSRLLLYEAGSDLPVKSCRVQTPLEQCEGSVLAKRIVLVPVLRAGLGMVDAFLEMLPQAEVGHIGLYRNEETLEPVEYYGKYPVALDEAVVYVLDPMLATGGSAVAALRVLQTHGAKMMRLVTLVSAPEGVRHVEEAFPEVPIYTAALDRGLNDKGYIIPGLGDAGDRIFDTGPDSR
ncbi:uracil phosphoribosyltransferase [bacterium]|nr:uracil phosphoribosyltransferase [bacterium]